MLSIIFGNSFLSLFSVKAAICFLLASNGNVNKNNSNKACLSPILPSDAVLIRYMYEGSVIQQGRLCFTPIKKESPCGNNVVTSQEITDALIKDGVNLDEFYPTVYENDASKGSWVPLWSHPDNPLTEEEQEKNQSLEFPIKKSSQQEGDRLRIDVKLCRRSVSTTPLSGKLPVGSYFGIGIVNPKTETNVGTLWRSAFQLGASFLYTVGARYKARSTDTVKAPSRIPLFSFDDINAFSSSVPRGAKWVAIEMDGTPLQNYSHPRNAIYILGSEDAGLPKSILRACHDVVSIPSFQYDSYNVAVAGSIVMYDRMMKLQDHDTKNESDTNNLTNK